MRQINFLIIFVMALALVLFSLENTEPVPVQIVRDIQFQAPLAIELLIAMGIGAVLAWVFSVWTRLLRLMESHQAVRQIRNKEERIQELEQDVERFKAELEEKQLPALSASQTLAEGVMAE